jgi:hypothetical protein
MGGVLRRVVVAGVVLGLVVAGALVWWVGLRREEPAPFTSWVATDSTRVQVTYTGGSCQDGSRLDVTEDRERVVLSVLTWTSATSCDDAGVEYTVSARLAEPLGSREVVDGACLDERFAGYLACATP